MRRGFSMVEILTTVAIIVILMAILGTVFFTTRGKSHQAVCTSNLQQIGMAIRMYSSDFDEMLPPAVSDTFVNNVGTGGQTWAKLVLPYAKAPDIFRCPLAQKSPYIPDTIEQVWITWGYGYNKNLSRFIYHPNVNVKNLTASTDAQVNYPVTTVELFDARLGMIASRGPDTTDTFKQYGAIVMNDGDPSHVSSEKGAYRHQEGANYGFMDGHVKWFKPDQLSTDVHNDGTRPGFGM